ncbi:MAG: type II toxin-antitoxin system HicA family toxin [Clostridia bacterium]|nr:type II toxin-antitoxin system HicA family toxin [Clostridia bacterium]
MSKWDKLIEKILKADRSIRFEELEKVLKEFGYKKYQPKGGSSHYTFRKNGCMPITIPRHIPLNRVYIEMVSEIVKQNLNMED